MKIVARYRRENEKKENKHWRSEDITLCERCGFREGKYRIFNRSVCREKTKCVVQKQVIGRGVWE